MHIWRISGQHKQKNLVKKLSLNTTLCFVYFMEVVYAKQFWRVEWGVVLGTKPNWASQLFSIDIRGILAKLMRIFYFWIIVEGQKFVT